MAEKGTPEQALMRLINANLHLAKGSARAAVVGFEQFARKLEHDNLLNPSLSENALVAGVVAGWSAALFEGSRLVEEAFTQWLEEIRRGSADKAPRKPTRR